MGTEGDDEGRRFELHNAITEGEGRETLREGMIVGKFLKPYVQRKNTKLVGLAKRLLVFLPDIPLLVNLLSFLFSPSLPRGLPSPILSVGKDEEDSIRILGGISEEAEAEAEGEDCRAERKTEGGKREGFSLLL